jgi:membrane protein
VATLIGVATIIVTASGVFGEMQSALNAIWKIDSRGTPISRLIRARAASLGLVVSLGFLMMVSLVVSVGLTALGDYLNSVLPFGKILLTILTALFRFSSFPCFLRQFTKCCPTGPSNGRPGSGAPYFTRCGGRKRLDHDDLDGRTVRDR